MALKSRRRAEPDPVAELRDRARELGGDVQGRAQEAAARAREASEPAIERVREVSEPALDRAIEVGEPVVRRGRDQLVRVLRTIARLAAFVPGLVATVLSALSSGLVRLADRSAEYADVPGPSVRDRRGRRFRTAMWFVGGFAAGTASGYVLNEARHRREDPFDGPVHAVPDAAQPGNDQPPRPATG